MKRNYMQTMQRTYRKMLRNLTRVAMTDQPDEVQSLLRKIKGQLRRLTCWKRSFRLGTSAFLLLLGIELHAQDTLRISDGLSPDKGFQLLLANDSIFEKNLRSGDMDGDGFVDYLVGDNIVWGTGEIPELDVRNLTPGLFSTMKRPQTTIPGGAGPIGTYNIFDYDLDGILDIASLTMYNDTVSPSIEKLEIIFGNAGFKSLDSINLETNSYDKIVVFTQILSGNVRHSISLRGNVDGFGGKKLVLSSTGADSEIWFKNGALNPGDTLETTDIETIEAIMMDTTQAYFINGFSEFARDVNGDGLDDAYVSTDVSYGEGRVIFGVEGGFDGAITSVDNLDGVSVDLTGVQDAIQVSLVNDINGDGFDEIAVSNFDLYGYGYAGEEKLYVIYGSDTLTEDLVFADLDIVADVVIDERLSALHGLQSFGDYDGDGLNDFGYIDSGEVHVISGNENGLDNVSTFDSLGNNGALVITHDTKSLMTMYRDTDLNMDGENDYFVIAKSGIAGSFDFDYYVIYGTPFVKQEQTLAFAPIQDLTTIDTSFVLMDTTQQGISVRYSSSDPTVATVDGNQITIMGEGEVTITASADGNYNYKDLQEVSRTFSAFDNPYVTLAGTGNENGVFSIDESNSFSVWQNFSIDQSTGSRPVGSLIRNNDKLWGLTKTGGDNNDGVIFTIDLEGSNYQVIRHFDKSVDGGAPLGTLMASDNLLWGTTTTGGNNGFGTIFQIDSTGNNFTVVHHFDGTGGDTPHGALIESNGYIWGTTAEGGSDNVGVIFRIKKDGFEFSTIHEFQYNSHDESNGPIGGLTEFGGKIWGTSEDGGPNTGGYIFNLNLDGSDFSIVHDFVNHSGPSFPTTRLLPVGNKLWGTTVNGGSGGSGVVYYYDVMAGTLAVVHDFVGDEGSEPNSPMIEVNNELWGMTNAGGTADGGTIYKLKINGTDFEIVKQLDADTGVGNPLFSPLLPVFSKRNIWDGTNWSVGLPDSISHGIIDADYSFSQDGIFAVRSLTVNSGSTLTIDTATLVIEGNLNNKGAMTVTSGSSLITYEAATVLGNPITFNRKMRFTDSEGRVSMVGTPVQQDARITGASLTTNGYAYKYDEEQIFDEGGDEGLDRWISAISDQLIPGHGYAQSFKQDLTFVGFPNHGTITVSGLSHTADAAKNTANRGWNLISNPYPAAIDVSKFLIENTNIDGSIALWDDGGSNIGRRPNADYLVVNSIGATGPNNGQYIGKLGAMQGFHVRVTNASTSTSIFFNETMRELGSNHDSSFFRVAAIEKVRISLKNEEGLYYNTLIGFTDAANVGYDRSYDASLIPGNADNVKIYSMMDDQCLAIQGLPSETRKVKLGLTVPKAGQYTISMEEGSGYELYDKMTHIAHDLSSSLSIRLAPGISNNRFTLRRAGAVLLSQQQNSNTWKVTVVDDQLWLIASTQVNSAYIDFRLYDLSGVMTRSYDRVAIVDGVATVSLFGISNGIILVRAEGAHDAVQKKVIINKQ